MKNIIEVDMTDVLIIVVCIAFLVLAFWGVSKFPNHPKRDRYDVPADTLKVEDNHLVNNNQ